LAFDLQTFRTRAITALLFVLVMLTGLLWNFQGFLILFILIHFGCWYEFVKLMKKIHTQKYLWYCFFGLIYITMPVLMIIDLGAGIFDAGLGIQHAAISGGSAFAGAYSPVIPCGIIFSIWINDTMAYLVGSFIGKTPFTAISPKKTLEGTLGGIILCVIIIGFLYPVIIKTFSDSRLPSGTWFIIPAICGIFGTAGDLLESKLKRLANVKDSGSFMPGHGGFLDRFDSLLLAVPAVWVYVYFLLND
jgi:phosphatidate cytidylyltransferase